MALQQELTQASAKMSLTCEIPSTRSEQAEQASMRIELSTPLVLQFSVQARSLVKVAQAQFQSWL